MLAPPPAPSRTSLHTELDTLDTSIYSVIGTVAAIWFLCIVSVAGTFSGNKVDVTGLLQEISLIFGVGLELMFFMQFT
ncbi:hypothetical protein HK104_008090, partial [Borealophlyctis nickersoniae]